MTQYTLGTVRQLNAIRAVDWMRSLNQIHTRVYPASTYTHSILARHPSSPGVCTSSRVYVCAPWQLYNRMCCYFRLLFCVFVTASMCWFCAWQPSAVEDATPVALSASPTCCPVPSPTQKLWTCTRSASWDCDCVSNLGRSRWRAWCFVRFCGQCVRASARTHTRNTWEKQRHTRWSSVLTAVGHTAHAYVQSLVG